MEKHLRTIKPQTLPNCNIQRLIARRKLERRRIKDRTFERQKMGLKHTQTYSFRSFKGQDMRFFLRISHSPFSDIKSTTFRYYIQLF